MNFAVDANELASAPPRHIEPDLYGGEAFLSVVVGEMERMRPVGVPRALGITYDQIVYRAVVRCGDERGVHFLRSDADSRVMTVFGNLMSFFQFHRAGIRFQPRGSDLDLDVRTTTDPSADIEATFAVGTPSDRLPTSSSFQSLEEARRWLVELFAAFSYSQSNDWVDIVRIKRGAWDVAVVNDTRARYAFMTAGAPFTSGRLDSVFLVGDVPYHWYRLEKRPLKVPARP